MPAQRIVEPHRLDDGSQIALDIEPLLQHRLDRLRPELKAGDIADHEIQPFDAVGVPGRSHQCARLFDGGPGVGLVPDCLPSSSGGVANSENG